MFNLPTKIELSISTHYEVVKDDGKFRKWGGLGSLGSFKVFGNNAIR